MLRRIIVVVLLLFVSLQTTTAQTLLTARPVLSLAHRAARATERTLIDHARRNRPAERATYGWRNDPVSLASIAARRAASAATWYAANAALGLLFDSTVLADCEEGTLQTWHDLAGTVNGDTANIPAGTCTWTTMVTITKALDIVGAGMGQTIIRDEVPKDGGSDDPLISITGNPFRVAHFTLVGVNVDSSNRGHIAVGSTIAGNEIDHIRFDPLRSASAVRVYNTFGGGVIHSSVVIADASTGGNGISNGLMHITGTPGEHGDDEWATASVWGSREGTWYLEDNVGSHAAPLVNNSGGLNDCDAGGAMVARLNILTHIYIQSHGLDDRDRGCRRQEIYLNFWENATTAQSDTIWFESGDGFIWGNAIGTGYTNGLRITYDVAGCGNCGGVRGVFGVCDGTSLYDQNAEGDGGDCADQPGRGQSNDLLNAATPTAQWVNNADSPIYIWDQVMAGSDVTPSIGAAQIDENQNFYDENGASCPAGGTCASGVGTGTVLPTACTEKTGFWKTNEGSWNDGSNQAYTGQGRLYKCTAPNVWTLWYTPLAYPHPDRTPTAGGGERKVRVPRQIVRGVADGLIYGLVIVVWVVSRRRVRRR